MAAKKMDLWVGGKSQQSDDKRTFEDLNPLDDSVYAHAARGSINDVNGAVAAARKCSSYFKRTPFSEREIWLLNATQIMERRKAEIIDCLIDEIGSPIGKANFEFQAAVSAIRAAAGLARQVGGRTYPSDHPRKLSISLRKPRGVVACITPFNVPLLKTAKQAASALALGNTVVLLPSELAPRLAMIVASIYHEAGLPAGAFNVITGIGEEIGDALTGHKHVDFVSFTGSSRVGQHIHEICTKNGTPVTLELGGKSPTVLLKDVDIEAIIPIIIQSSFLNSGQACIASSRIFVEEPLFQTFSAKFAAAASNLKFGDLRNHTTMVGPIISERQRTRIRVHMEEAIEKGASLLAGGEWHGNICEPTVLSNVSDDMLIANEETFGPVVTIQSIGSLAEGIEKSNRSKFGLSSSIFTNDLSNAFEFSEEVKSGMCHINGPTLQDEPHVPFGGVGDSGFGREGTEADLLALTEVKWVTVQF